MLPRLLVVMSHLLVMMVRLPMMVLHLLAVVPRLLMMTSCFLGPLLLPNLGSPEQVLGSLLEMMESLTAVMPLLLMMMSCVVVVMASPMMVVACLVMMIGEDDHIQLPLGEGSVADGNRAHSKRAGDGEANEGLICSRAVPLGHSSRNRFGIHI